MVDDEPGSRAVLTHILELAGLAVVDAVANGRAALDRIRSTRPDLVVTDIRMPGITGVEVAIRIQEEGRPNGPTLVAVTRHPEDVGNTDVFDLVLQKPVSPSRLIEWLRGDGQD